MSINRLDAELVRRGLYQSRERAKKAIEAELVLVCSKTVIKPSFCVDENTMIEILGDPIGYVGRGGLKLMQAVEYWKIDLNGTTAMDVGASTGGFTQCLLRNGAKCVYSVDVGHGQLSPELLSDKRIYNYEGNDIRGFDPGILFDFVTVDVSFISLALVLPDIFRLMKHGAKLVCLVKPQFELTRKDLSKKGIVKTPKLRIEALDKIRKIALMTGLFELGHIESSIQGRDGNVEYLLFLQKPGT